MKKLDGVVAWHNEIVTVKRAMAVVVVAVHFQMNENVSKIVGDEWLLSLTTMRRRRPRVEFHIAVVVANLVASVVVGVDAVLMMKCACL
jgi:hypothetical protein